MKELIEMQRDLLDCIIEGNGQHAIELAQLVRDISSLLLQKNISTFDLLKFSEKLAITMSGIIPDWLLHNWSLVEANYNLALLIRHSVNSGACDFTTITLLNLKLGLAEAIREMWSKPFDLFDLALLLRADEELLEALLAQSLADRMRKLIEINTSLCKLMQNAKQPLQRCLFKVNFHLVYGMMSTAEAMKPRDKTLIGCLEISSVIAHALLHPVDFEPAEDPNFVMVPQDSVHLLYEVSRQCGISISLACHTSKRMLDILKLATASLEMTGKPKLDAQLEITYINAEIIQRKASFTNIPEVEPCDANLLPGCNMPLRPVKDYTETDEWMYEYKRCGTMKQWKAARKEATEENETPTKLERERDLTPEANAVQAGSGIELVAVAVTSDSQNLLPIPLEMIKLEVVEPENVETFQPSLENERTGMNTDPEV